MGMNKICPLARMMYSPAFGDYTVVEAQGGSLKGLIGCLEKECAWWVSKRIEPYSEGGITHEEGCIITFMVK